MAKMIIRDQVIIKKIYTEQYQLLNISSFFIKMGQPRYFFAYFRSFQTQMFHKNCRLQRDLNSERRSRRRARWLLDHHGPTDYLIFSAWNEAKQLVESHCLKRDKNSQNMGSGVAQLVERSIPIPEVRSLNPARAKIHIKHLLSTVLKRRK